MVMERNLKKCCGKYGLIFMDINMPVMDGMEAMKILKKKMELGEIKETQIIAVTAARCENEEDRKVFLEAGFDECGK
jgi:CheY-like chemotaxis protein